MEKDLRWDFDSYIGEEVFVGGQVKLYPPRDQWEIVIADPKQIARSADDIDMATIPLPETKKKAAPKKAAKPIAGAFSPKKKDYPELPLKLEETSVNAISYYIQDTGMKIPDDPYGLPTDRITATVAAVNAVVKKVPGSGPMQIKFPEVEKDSKEHIQEVVDLLAETYGKWPKDVVLTIDVDFDTREFRDDPSSLVIAALIHSLATGNEISYDVIVSADLAADGSLVPTRGNVDGEVPTYKLLNLIAEDSGEAVRFICADVTTDELNDLALDDAWETLSNVSVIGASNLKEALQLMFVVFDSPLGEALGAFDEAQQVIRKSGAQMVRNSHVQQRVMTTGKTWPQYRSAAFYALYARGKVSRTYSLPYSRFMLGEMHNELRFMQISEPADPKEKFREYEDKLKEIRNKLHPDLSKLVRSLGDFQSAAASSVIRPREGRALERETEKLKEADQEVVEGLSALQDMIDGVEPEE